jgi:hypothetical protein
VLLKLQFEAYPKIKKEKFELKHSQKKLEFANEIMP